MVMPGIGLGSGLTVAFFSDVGEDLRHYTRVGFEAGAPLAVKKDWNTLSSFLFTFPL